jgi:hypothetical protein
VVVVVGGAVVVVVVGGAVVVVVVGGAVVVVVVGGAVVVVVVGGAVVVVVVGGAVVVVVVVVVVTVGCDRGSPGLVPAVSSALLIKVSLSESAARRAGVSANPALANALPKGLSDGAAV